MRFFMNRRNSLLLCMLLWQSALAAGIEVNPTADDQLPKAILGEAAKPGGKSVRYFAEDRRTKGYLAVPKGRERRGAVILIHEWNGLVPRVRQVADSFAAEGYVALAADLYSGRTGKSRTENLALMREARADEKRIIANLQAAVDFLKARPDVNGRVATLGWCFGGGVALSFALDGENHEGTAIFYGSLLADPERLSHIHHEIYGTFAGLDNGIPPSAVDEFAKALRRAGVPNDLHIYDDVRHGFWLHVDRDPAANRGPALDAWQRLKRYLERTLSSPSDT